MVTDTNLIDKDSVGQLIDSLIEFEVYLTLERLFHEEGILDLSFKYFFKTDDLVRKWYANDIDCEIVSNSWPAPQIIVNSIKCFSLYHLCQVICKYNTWVNSNDICLCLINKYYDKIKEMKEVPHSNLPYDHRFVNSFLQEYKHILIEIEAECLFSPTCDETNTYEFDLSSLFSPNMTYYFFHKSPLCMMPLDVYEAACLSLKDWLNSKKYFQQKARDILDLFGNINEGMKKFSEDSNVEN